MPKIRREYLGTILAGAAAVIIGIALFIGKVSDEVIPMTLINAGLILIVIAVVAHIRYGDRVHKDERTRKIGARAVSYSWFITILLVNVLFWSDHTGAVTLSTRAVLGIIMFTMLFSASIIQLYLKLRGVVNED